jgi:hypothetical protein
MDTGHLHEDELDLLRSLLGSSFFHLHAHDASFDADGCVMAMAGVSIEQARGVWIHLASDWWEDSDYGDHFKLKAFRSSSVMHPSVSRGATSRVVFAPQDSERAVVPVGFYNRGKLEEIEVYRGAPPGVSARNESDTLLVFRHGGQTTFALSPMFLPWGCLQLSFSEERIREWKASYSILTTLRRDT